jgi:hypothetical protein
MPDLKFVGDRMNVQRIFFLPACVGNGATA